MEHLGPRGWRRVTRSTGAVGNPQPGVAANGALAGKPGTGVREHAPAARRVDSDYGIRAGWAERGRDSAGAGPGAGGRGGPFAQSEPGNGPAPWDERNGFSRAPVSSRAPKRIGSRFAGGAGI